MSSIAVFILGMGMFGVIIYLPLFMQGVLGVSATQSAILLTPLMLGCGDGKHRRRADLRRAREVQALAIVGSMLIALGMILFAAWMRRPRDRTVVLGMIVAGFGMGLLKPVYTVAVQNVAPRQHMGAATASTSSSARSAAPWAWRFSAASC